jgi:hypothetical protein
MITRHLSSVGVILLAVASLAAPVALLALGNHFRIAARMATDGGGPLVWEQTPAAADAALQLAAIDDADARW